MQFVIMQIASFDKSDKRDLIELPTDSLKQNTSLQSSTSSVTVAHIPLYVHVVSKTVRFGRLTCK